MNDKNNKLNRETHKPKYASNKDLVGKDSSQKVLIRVLAVFVVLSVLFGILAFMTYNNVVGYYEYDSSLRIGDYVGFNLQTDKLHFGTVIPGSHSRREISINTTVPGYVILSVSGPLKDSLFTFDEFTYVESAQQKSFMIYAAPPLDMKKGNYTSKIHVYVLKHMSPVLELLLKGKQIKVLGEGSSIREEESKVLINISYPNETSDGQSSS